MTRLLIQNTRLLVPGPFIPHGWLLIEAGRIADLGEGPSPAVEDAEVIDGGGKTALPGFIDVHVHGAVGHDTMDGSPEGLQAMSRFYAAHGVTSFLATTMTQAQQPIMRALEAIAACAGPVENGATILGAHLEGPYINVKMKGAQAAEFVRAADPQEYKPWLDLNVIKQVTVAPEFPENQEFIRECVRRGVNVSIGHTQATYEDVENAIQLGARQTTHTFNAMIGIHHRKPGTAGAALTLDTLTCELIACSAHLHMAIMKLIVRAKDTDKVVFVTDAMMGVGMDEAVYDLGGQQVTVKNRTATLADGSLAGSVITMDQGVRTVMEATGYSLAEVWPMSSANAARQIGLADRKGTLRPGFDADVVLMDEANQVAMTIAAGRIVYQA
jgi:N-acetylglucosamine-6-phosphate deacetylase